MQNDETNLDVQETQENESAEPVEATEPEVDWKAEALKQKAINARLSKKLEKPQPLQEEKSQPKGLDPDSLIDNLALIKDFQQEELAEARKEAKELGIDLFKFIQSNPGKAHMEQFRSQRKTADTTLAPSSRGVTFKGKAVAEVLKDESASEADKQAAFEAMLGRRRGGSNL